MTTYRITADDKPIGVIDTLTLSPDDILVVTVASKTTDKDLSQVRDEVRTFFKSRETWHDQPVIVVRAGEIKFQRITPTAGVSTEGAAWALEVRCDCTHNGIFPHNPHCPASPEHKARHIAAQPEQE